MSTLEEQKEAFLAHYGVKGMRWGKTKQQYKSLGRDEKKQYRKKTLKERREGHKEALEANARLAIEAASVGGQHVFIKTRTSAGDIYPSVYTGKEFVDYLSKGGAFDMKMTSVFGYTKTEEGQKVKDFVDKSLDAITSEYNQTYVKKDS